MEKQSRPNCFNLRNFKNKFVLVVCSYLAFNLLGCQTERWVENHNIHQTVRVTHAKAILQNRYSQLNLKKFEFDYSFEDYLRAYLNQAGPQVKPESLVPDLMHLSQSKNFDPVFLIAIMKTESKFDTEAIGSHGEIGLMQIKPSTAEWICKKYGLKWKGKEALKDPSYNLQVGAYYFTYLRKSLKQQSKKYINAYNTGINSLQRMPAEVQKNHPYYHAVMRNYAEIYNELAKIKENKEKI